MDRAFGHTPEPYTLHLGLVCWDLLLGTSKQNSSLSSRKVFNRRVGCRDLLGTHAQIGHVDEKQFSSHKIVSLNNICKWIKKRYLR